MLASAYLNYFLLEKSVAYKGKKIRMNHPKIIQ